MNKIIIPNTTDKTNRITFKIPSVLKDSLIIIVEIIKPEEILVEYDIIRLIERGGGS